MGYLHFSKRKSHKNLQRFLLDFAVFLGQDSLQDLNNILNDLLN